MTFLNKYKEHSYALLRIVSGYLFFWHGTQKGFDFPKAGPEQLNALMTLGTGIELIGGALIVLGLFTRYAAFVASGSMAVGYWLFHASQANPALPLLNGGELAIMFCFTFLYIASQGSGHWSLDKALNQ
ncbi:MAG: DoxX family protein [Arenicella sp.]